jgi:thiol-disulfide isomerase/thioredoxin
MTYLEYPIQYLELEDFDSDGNIINPNIPKDKTVLIMVQALFCGHCTTSKPYFQNLANTHPEIVCLTVQGDAEKSEIELAKMLLKKSGSRGFPAFLKYKNGIMSSEKYSGDRTTESLYQFSTS